MHGGMRYEKMMIRELIKEQNKAARRLAEERGCSVEDIDKSEIELSDKAYK